MDCHTRESYRQISSILEKLEVLSRLSPMVEGDAEFARILAVLMDVMGDYIRQLRTVLNTLVSTEEGGQP